ncbi:MAG: SMC-Scp complex subunit ScpB, partial [Patescibacteria group bacterium]
MKSKLMLDSQIEAVLFWKAEPISIKRLSEILERNESEIKSSILILEKRLEGSGLSLIQMNDEITLSTSVEVSSLIIKLTKEELIRDLGKAGLETISIILYQGPISRAEIDYIRGVNSL